MTWKRCDGCTRAIASAALTCEYCGHAFEDPLDPQRAEAAQTPRPWTLDDFTPDTDDERPHALPPLELNASFPFSPEYEEPAEQDQAPPFDPESLEASGAFVRDDLEEADEDDDPTSPGRQAIVFPEDGEPQLDGGQAPAPDARAGLGTRGMVMGGAAVASVALIFTMLSMRGSASPTGAASSDPAAPAPAPTGASSSRPLRAEAVPIPAATSLPSWSRVTDGRWADGARRSAAFELPAVNKIQIWTRAVTPVLVVRCQDGRAEAFVFTQSAARMETQDEDHTVRVTFDDSAEATERWPDSVDHDALFARDSVAFTRQLAASQRLHFGFEPHNAPPALARFEVGGLGQLLSEERKLCGW